MTTIPFFPYSDLFEKDRENLLGLIDSVCSKGAYIMQQELRDFEINLARFINAKYVYGVANGTDAIIIGLKAVRISQGDEVIIPSHTYIATAAAIHLVGSVPVLAECGSDHMLDVNDIEHRINSNTKAIMPVQINGRTCDMDKIQVLADKYNLLVLEDAAQGLGSKYKGRYAGTLGSFGTFSFYPAKLLGCFGDGGAIVTNDDELAGKISLLRDHGRDDSGDVVAWGYNSRLDNLQAAILDYKLKAYPMDIERRRYIASCYQRGLGDIKQLDLPPAPGSNDDYFDVYQNYELEADSRDDLRSFLEQNGIKTIIQWAGTPVHQFSQLGFSCELPLTDHFFKRCLMLPMNTSVSDEEIKYIIKKVRNFYEYS